jgi:oligopeptide/dipeptide ABC transporter ATP-binding protein
VAYGVFAAAAGAIALLELFLSGQVLLGAILSPLSVAVGTGRFVLPGGLLFVLADGAAAAAAVAAGEAVRIRRRRAWVAGIVVSLLVVADEVLGILRGLAIGSVDGNLAFLFVTVRLIDLGLGGGALWGYLRQPAWFRPDPLEAPLPPAGQWWVAPAHNEAPPARTAGPDDDVLLYVEGLKKHFPILGGLLRRQVGTVYAVDGVDFAIRRGEVFSLVGESGCGKTTLGRTILQLIPPTAGRVIFDGYELADVDPAAMIPLRRRMQIIFQDPFGSLNPRMPISDVIGEGLLAQGVRDRKTRDRLVEESLEAVGLRREYSRRYPHEFSGGQRQRIGIARALALRPDFIVCDEPVSALDVSIRSQILNLLLDLRREFHLTYLFISHDLSVVEYISDRIAVMYLGKIVEIAEARTLYEDPRHPYTVALLSAIPQPDPRRRRKRLVLRGDVPSPAAPPRGCRFHTRCWLREVLGNPERCVTEEPALREVAGAHQAACHYAEEISPETIGRFTAAQSALETAVAGEA